MISYSFLIWLILIISSDSFWILFVKRRHYKLVNLNSWFFRSDSKSIAKLKGKEGLSYVDFFVLIFLFYHIFLELISLAEKPCWRSCRHFSFSWPVFALISFIFIFPFCWLNVFFINAIWAFIAAWVVLYIGFIVVVQPFIV